MRIPHASLVLLLAVTGSLSASEWVLTYAVTEVREIESPDGKTPAKHEESAFTQTVVLGGSYLVVQDDRQKTVYDFAGQRLIRLKLADATYDGLPLCSLVDSLDYELMNRIGLGAALRAGKLGPAAAMFDRFDNETMLRVTTRRAPPEPSPAKLTQKPLPDGLEFQRDGQTIATFLPAAKPLPREFQHRLANYLAYAWPIHPDVRAAIAATGSAPRELVFKWHNLNTRGTTTLRLLSAQSADTDSSVQPAGAKPAAHASEPLYQVLAASQELIRTGQRPSRAAAVAFAAEAVAQRRPLDGLLALMEYTLQSGEPITKELQVHRAAFNGDEACQRYLAALKPADKAGTAQSLKIVETIDRTKLQKAYLLDLERANLLDAIGRPREARELYLAVVRANPAHAGALHDLGMSYARNFEQPAAWSCWDAARKLSPNHFLMTDVARREKQLVADYPDFF